MRYIKPYAAWITAAVIALVGFLVLAPAPASAAFGPQPVQKGTSVGVPYFAVGAIVVIAAFAIWQGYNDSKKKKEAQKQKEKEREEQNEFDKYFEEESGADDAAGTGDGTTTTDTTPPAETPSGDTTPAPATTPTGP